MGVTLIEFPSKTVVMDVVIANIPPKFGVLLSMSWTSKLKRRMQMDMSYATIPMARGSKRLYNEKTSPFVVRSQDKLDDHAIYAIDTNLGSSIFFNDVSPFDLEIFAPIKAMEEKESVKKQEALEEKQKEEGL